VSLTSEPDDVAVEGTRKCPKCDAEVPDGRFRFCTSCGAELSSGPGTDLVPVAGDDDEEAPGWWGRWRRWVLMGAAVVVAVPVALYLSWQWSGLRTADGPVRDLFLALEDRDGPAIAAALEGVTIMDGVFTGEGDPLAGPLFEAGALEEGYTPPTLVDVEVDYFADASGVEQRPDKSMAQALVHFTIGDDPTVWEWPIYMDREDSGFDRQWSIAALELGRIAGVADAAMRIAGTTLEAGQENFALPGAYEVAVADQVLWEDTSGTVIVGGEDYIEYEPAPSESATGFVDDGPIDLAEGQEPLTQGTYDILVYSDLDLQLRSEVQPAVEQSIQDQVNACAEPYQLDWDTCPFTLDSDDVGAANIASALDHGSEWTVTAWPTIKLVTDFGFVQVQVAEPGRAEGTYLGNEDGSPGLVLLDDDYEAELFPYGTVGVDESGQIVWTYTP
jgi:hypothetical protein